MRNGDLIPGRTVQGEGRRADENVSAPPTVAWLGTGGRESLVCCLCGLEPLSVDLELGSRLGLEGWP